MTHPRPARSAYILLVALLLGLLTPARQSSADEKKQPTTRAFFWKVSSGEHSVHFLGSMHVASKDMYPLPQEIEDAFAKSTVLVEEIDMSKLDPPKMLMLVKDKGMYSNGDTLSKKVSDATWTALKKYCDDNQLPAPMFETFRPWMAGMTLQVVAMQKMGMDPNLGIDKHFLDAAMKDKRKVEELETAEFQMNLLAGFPDDLQEKMLMAALLDAKNLQEGIGRLRDAWLSGDPAQMDAMLNKSFKEHPELAVVEQKLITDRNPAMADKIEGYLNGKEQAFIAIGAAHLIGDKGILKLLADKKYKIEQVEVTAAKHPAS